MIQTTRLLGYLLVSGSIHPLDAWAKLGIYRLSAVIFELRKQGWDIKTNTIKVINQFGETCKVANYEMETIYVNK